MAGGTQVAGGTRVAGGTSGTRAWVERGGTKVGWGIWVELEGGGTKGGWGIQVEGGALRIGEKEKKGGEKGKKGKERGEREEQEGKKKDKKWRYLNPCPASSAAMFFLILNYLFT